MANRLDHLLKHLEPQSVLELRPCIGEMENRVVDDANDVKVGKSSKSKYQRIPIKILFEDKSMADERYGGSGDVVILEGEHLKPPTESKTLVIFMHPSGIQNLLPMPIQLAKQGVHVMTCASRYPNNDSCLIMEKVVLDLGACVTHAKTKMGYEKVALAGWSGGGSLSSFYQGQAEKLTVTHTPAGDPIDLSKIQKADALLILAAHASRAKIFTEWLDPAVLDESDPSVRDPELDIYNPNNPNQPPYSKEFVRRYREAQIERNRRITRWAQAKLRLIDERYKTTTEGWEQKRRDITFSVPCTQADIRRLDPTLEPNGRAPTTLETLAAENHSPVGLAKFTTLRSWLSQWSYDLSNADGPSNLQNVTVPVLVVANEADHLVPYSHPLAMFEAVKHENKQHHVVKGATHYYFGQPDKLAEAAGLVKRWLESQQL